MDALRTILETARGERGGCHVDGVALAAIVVLISLAWFGLAVAMLALGGGQ